MQGSAYEDHDGHALGEGLARRIEDKDGTIGTALYADMIALQERNRETVEDDAVELDDPASIFDHARSALRKLTGTHAGDDFARGLLRSVPAIERSAVEDVPVEDEWVFAEEVLGEDEVAV